MNFPLKLFLFFFLSGMCDQLKIKLKWEPSGPTVPLEQQSTLQERVGGQGLHMWQPAWNVTDMWQEGQPEILTDAELRAGAGSQGGQRAVKQFMTLVLCTCENAPRTHC